MCNSIKISQNYSLEAVKMIISGHLHRNPAYLNHSKSQKKYVLSTGSDLGHIICGFFILLT